MFSSTRRSPRLALVLLVLLVLLLGSVPALAQDRSARALDTSDLFGIEAKHPTLDSTLARVAAAAEQSDARSAARRAPISQGDAVAVTIYADRDAAALFAALGLLGARVTNSRDNVIEAYVPARQLRAVAGLAGVAAVEALVPPRASVASQGAPMHGATNWNQNGYTGAGVKVGVIDVGFAGYSSLIGSELPPTLGLCYTGPGATSSNLADCDNGELHGTAVAETVVDVAPQAQLYIANPQTSLDLLDAVDWMAAQGVTVINHSVGWVWDGPGDGTSPYSNSPLVAVDLAVSYGITWVNAAGNEGTATWTGNWSDADGDFLLEFAPSYEFNGLYTYGGSSYMVQMRWNDTWAGATTDLDLYLVDSALNIVAYSRTEQSGRFGDEPFELLQYTAFTDEYLWLVVEHYTGPAPAWVQLQEFNGYDLEIVSGGGSIGSPADSANAGLLAVGAVDWQTPSVIEEFSSQGPTRDGRLKPDIVGFDRGDTVSYGPRGFPGTSQASPHVAGLAALVKQRFPQYTPQQVADYLKSNAIPVGGAPNNVWGYGIAHLPEVTGGGDPAPDNEAFGRTWARTDDPVSNQYVNRTWMWGNGPFTGPMWEPYDEGTGGRRVVKYYDKSRMEITNPSSDPSSIWYVTNGLLVMELITGDQQLGNDRFEYVGAAEVNVAGDGDDPTGPTYASFWWVLEEPAAGVGTTLTQRIDRHGNVWDDPTRLFAGVTAGYYVPETGHTIAQPFWSFMNSVGLVYDGEAYYNSALFPNPFYATGYPVTEAYWATVKVAGTYVDVLIQCFERRCLTYTPGNPPGWQVEAGNVGQHYYIWRYGSLP